MSQTLLAHRKFLHDLSEMSPRQPTARPASARRGSDKLLVLGNSEALLVQSHVVIVIATSKAELAQGRRILRPWPLSTQAQPQTSRQNTRAMLMEPLFGATIELKFKIGDRRGKIEFIRNSVKRRQCVAGESHICRLIWHEVVNRQIRKVTT
jgi:hypothetical protein